MRDHKVIPLQEMSVYMETCGGLGNQLFQICALMQYAEKTKRKFFIKKNNESSSVCENRSTYWNNFLAFLQTGNHLLEEQEFNNQTKNCIVYEDVNPIYGYKTIPNFKLPSNEKNKNVLLKGYFQALPHIQDYLPTFLQSVKNVKKPEINEEDVNAFIHIRRGDYLQLQHTHPILPIQYYEKAIHLFLQKNLNRKIQFRIYCEQKDEEQIKLDFSSSPMLNFYIHSYCDHKMDDYEQMLEMSSYPYGGILANSTFSCWAAYFSSSDKKTFIYPYLWFAHTERIPDLFFSESNGWVQCSKNIRYEPSKSYEVKKTGDNDYDELIKKRSQQFCGIDKWFLEYKEKNEIVESFRPNVCEIVKYASEMLDFIVSS